MTTDIKKMHGADDLALYLHGSIAITGAQWTRITQLWDQIEPLIEQDKSIKEFRKFWMGAAT